VESPAAVVRGTSDGDRDDRKQRRAELAMRHDDSTLGGESGTYFDAPVDALDRGTTCAVRDRKPVGGATLVLGRLSLATRVVYVTSPSSSRVGR